MWLRTWYILVTDVLGIGSAYPREPEKPLLKEPDPLEMGVSDRTVYSRGQQYGKLSEGELQRKLEKRRGNLKELLKKYL